MFFTSEKWSYGKPRHPWRENWQAAFLFSRCRKGLWTSVQLTILLHSKKTNVKATLQNTQRDVKLLQTLLGTRNELKNLKNSSSGVKRIHLRVYHFGKNQRLWAIFAPKSTGKFWTTSKRKQLLCQYHEWPRIWESKKSPPVQTERAKKRRRKQDKCFDSFKERVSKWNSFHCLIAVNCHIIVWMKSQYLKNKQITSWLVHLYDFYSLVVKNRKLTHLKTRSFVCDSSQLVNKNRPHSPTMK